MIRPWVRLPDRFRIEHHMIARNMAVVAVFLLIAKLIALAKEMAVAKTFGIGPVVDAYLFVFNLVGIPAALWYSVTYAIVIPLSAKLGHTDPAEEQRFCAELLGATILVGLGAGFLAWLALRLLLGWSSLGLAPETHADAITAANYLSFVVPLGLAANYGSVLLMARGRQANSLLEAMPAFALLVALLLWQAGGLHLLLWGTIVGLAFQLAITFLLLGAGAPRPRLGFSSSGWTEFRTAAGLMFATQLMLALTPVVDQFFAADLPSGSIATLGYATRIQGLVLALASTVIGRAMLPVYAKTRNTDPDALQGIARRWTLILFILGCGLAIVIAPAAELIVRLLFERGAFGSEDTREVATVLQWGLTQLPFYFAMIAASQLMFTTGRYRLATLIAFVALALKIPFSFALVGPLGVAGLMASTAVAQAISCLLLLWALRVSKPSGNDHEKTPA